ncbi:GyrI-like domain-containing protein [Seohaeicola saemankumensis]|nr:GyrI-like domain-containing protein [Seohaeicola saemankumensis]MCA0872939.1 GyrI-like domain-containing protein [Seohaeicola saemankumensis]
MTAKRDFKKTDRAWYTAPRGRWDRLVLPPLNYLAIDGQGDPNGPDYGRALAALYPMAYGGKALCKALGRDFVVPPLQALWSAEDPAAFVAGDRAAWQWTAMIRMPEELTAEMVETARQNVLAKLARKPGAATDAPTVDRVRQMTLDEGDCLQRLHIGPYTVEAPTLADLHDRVMPALGLTFNGPHHEIYLGDPRRAAPERLRTILRQPVRPLDHPGSTTG